MKHVISLNLLVIYLLFHQSIFPAQAAVAWTPGSAKACAICHYRWIDTFFVEGRGSDLVGYTSEKVVATPDMCFSCHDGSVTDSRARVNNDYGHKTNKPPPSHMKIPKIFPLDEGGNVQCSTCHTAHGVSWTTEKESIFLRTPNRDSAMCRMCHPDYDGGIEAGNHPIGTTKREISQRLIALGGVAGRKKNQVICETCHTAHGSPYESMLIKSGKDCGICLECHSDKRVYRTDGGKNPFHVINVAPIRAKVPQELVKRGASFGYKGTIVCQTCHKVHNKTTREKLLLIANDRNSTLCLTCHAEQKHVADTKHNLAHSAPQEKNQEGQTVTEEGVCSACHLPHKAARRLYGEGDFTTQLCRSCHSKGNVAENPRLFGYSHPMNVNPLERKPAGVVYTLVHVDKEKLTLPLFNKFGIQDKNGKMVCSTCHDPHRWQADSTKGETRKDVKGDRTTSFLRQGSPEICGECHSDKFYMANSRHDLNKVAPEEKNILRQTPSESGLCGSCHLVHGGKKDFLWAREITSRSDSVVQDLCVSCHNKKGMAKEKVIRGYSHPVNVSPAEKGLTTSLPLFDKNDKIYKDGVMRCHTCHDPHRSDPSKALAGHPLDIKENLENRFLRLKHSPSPKLCEDCHADEAYVEGTDHDLVVTAPSSKNIMGRTPVESGICAVCHLVHNSKNQVRLWARDFGTGDNIVEKMCNSCHSENGPARNKIRATASHPEDVFINNAGGNTKDGLNYFPLFHRTSGELITVGYISCPSCHNVHQWDPRFPAKGNGVNVEGSANNSFLRARAHSLPCKDCHGPDALFRLLYFHEPSKRQDKDIEPQ